MTTQADPKSGARGDWSWLDDTYWYVPTPDLPALNLAGDRDTLSWLDDQTVWHIRGVSHGYFFGVCAVMMVDPEAPGRARITHLKLLGTVTPRGRVQLTFVPAGPRALVGPTVGYGDLITADDGAPIFEMQMSTDRLRQRSLHWAHMLQTREGEASWSKLPGTDLSVPEMLDGAEYPRFDD